MKKLLSILLLLSLLVTCIPLAGAEDIELNAPTVYVNPYKYDESGVPVVYSGEPLYASFNVTKKAGGSLNWDEIESLAVKYTVTRDSDGADVTVIPKSNAVERTTSLGSYFNITDGKKMTPGSYTIKAKVICTYKGFKDSPEATQKVIVSSETAPAKKKYSFEITNGEKKEKYDTPRFKIGEQIIASILAPGATTANVYFEGKWYPVTLKDGAGTFTSDPITKGNYSSIELGTDVWNDYTWYEVKMSDLSVTFDKKSYSIGDTAKVTLTCADAEYFNVSMEYVEKKEVEDDEFWANMTGSIKYLAKSGTATIEVPLTEAGFLEVFVSAKNETYYLQSGKTLAVQVDNPENIRYTGEVSDKEFADDLVAPTGLTIVPGTNGGLTLSWSAAADASAYDVYSATSASGTFKLLATVQGTSYTDMTAPVGQVVYYRVVSARNTADGRYSASGDPETAPFKGYILLAKTKKVSVKVDKAKTLSISVKKVKGADSYEVYYTTKKKDVPKASTKPTVTIKSGTKIDATKKVKSGKTYYIYVRAVKKLDDGTKAVGPWSKVVKKKTK